MSDSPQHGDTPQHGEHRLPPYVPQQPHPAGYPVPQSTQPVQPASSNVNAAGRVALILGIIALGINIIMSILFQVLVRTDGYQLYGIVDGVGSLLSFAAALAAIIVGFSALRRRGASQVSAGIAIGIGLTIAVSRVFGFVTSTIASLPIF